MSIFSQIEERAHEQVVFCSDKESGLRAIIAIHDTTLGPSLGGCRVWPFENEEKALEDVLRLSRGMTYKSAAAGLNLGGGKAVIIGDSKKIKSERLFRAFGRFVQSLGGRYITAEDVGTTVSDMEYIRMETDYVVGIHKDFGGSGDPSPMTATGVFHGIRAALKKHFGRESLEGKRVAIQGLGHVGFGLLEHLIPAGASVIGTDIEKENTKKAVREYPSIEIIEPDKIYDVDCDVFAPCALGGVVNDETIKKFKCAIIAGSANNVLADEEKHSLALKEKGIIYAPDFVISSGGLINVVNELEGYQRTKALHQTEGIYDIVANILDIASNENITTLAAAKRMAELRIESMSSVKKTYVGVRLSKQGRGIR